MSDVSALSDFRSEARGTIAMNQSVMLSEFKSVVDHLTGAFELLRTTETLRALRTIDANAAAELRRAILRVVGFLDDSVSNPALGSIFDRTATNPLNSMADSIASAYGVARSYPGTTGTTGLNVPAVMTLAGQGDTIAIARDCHVSVIAGISLSGARPVYLVPPFDASLGVLMPPTASEVAQLLDSHPEIRGVVLTMPTYHGLMGDIDRIVGECHRRGVPVMVDEAHGPHFHFLQGLGFPRAAEDARADIVSQSTHKVLPALNQGSLLHFNSLALTRRYEELQAMGFQSTSFSYPILLSIEHAVEQMVTRGEQVWRQALAQADRLREGASELPGVTVLDNAVFDSARIIGVDPTRVTINVRNAGLSGYDVERLLYECGILIEMATTDVVLFLVGCGVSDEQIEEALAALRTVFAGRSSTPRVSTLTPPAPPAQVLTPRGAITMMASRERVPVRSAVGGISAETIGCYPPGQAIIVAGERVTWDVVTYLKKAVEAGAHLKRVQDDHFQTIEMIRESNEEAYNV